MEIRRVQVTGGSSFVVTLPKEWIKSTNVKKNDPLGLIVQPNGTLLVTTNMTKNKVQRTKEFNVTDTTNQTYLLRQLVGAYIAGYNSIELKSSKRMPQPIRTTVRRFTQITIGQEVVEETDALVVIKDLLDPAEMPLDKTLKRMHIIVKNMYEDAMSAFKNSSKKIAEDVISRDNDVDRLHWLVARQTNIILRNISLAEKMGVTPREASTCFLISRITERIGDHAVRIAENSFPLFENKLNEEIVNSICSAGNVILDIFNKSIGAFFRGNVKVANENIEKVKKFEGKLKEINTLILKQKGVTAVSLGHILESIRRVGEYGEDISESVINQFVEKEK